MNEEITLEELSALPEDSYTIIDIRDSYAFELGHMDGAVNIPAEDLDGADLPQGRKLVICCRSGIISDEAAEKLRERGMDAVNLSGGYVRWLGEKIRRESSAAKAADIERSITKSSTVLYSASSQRLSQNMS